MQQIEKKRKICYNVANLLRRAENWGIDRPNENVLRGWDMDHRENSSGRKKVVRVVRKNVVNINDPEFEKVAVCLSLKLRRDILLLLSKKALTTVEIAEKLNEPVSTIATNVKMLERAGLIMMLEARGRGNARPMVIKCAYIVMDLRDNQDSSENQQKRQSINVPIGSFCDCATSTYYGLASPSGVLAGAGSGLWVPNRGEAELLWIAGCGYVSYKISNLGLKKKELTNFSFSLELCSETSTYNNRWESDITFWLNGVELCAYHSPGDFGGRRGMNNPEWWQGHMSQYGQLVTVSVTNEGTYLNNTRVSDCVLGQLKLGKGDCFELKIGVKENARSCGGFNIFGKGFGDYKQDIVIYYDYLSRF